MKRGCLSLGTIRLSAIASLNALVLLVSTGAFAQIAPSNGRTIDLNRQLDEQLNIPLNNGTQGDTRNQADFFLRLGGQAQRDGNLQKAITNWLQALDLYQEIGDLEGLGVTYDYLGLTYAKLGRYQQAEDALRRRLGVARTRYDFQGQIYGLNNLATVLLQAGNFGTAQ